MRSRAFLVSLVWLGAAPLQAQTAATIDCSGGGASTVEINYCAERDLDAADKRLNDAYRAALAAIKASGLDAKPRREWREALQDAQRKWLAFRDADCKGPVAYEWYGGTGATAAVLTCLTEKTVVRTKELESRNPR